MADLNVLKQHASLLNVMLHVTDWVIITSTSFIAHWLYLGDIDLSSKYSYVVVISLLLSVWVFPRFSLYQTWRGVSLFEEIRMISLSWGLVWLGLTALVFTTKTGADFSRGWMGVWGALAWLGLIAGRLLLRSTLRWFRRNGFNQRHVIIVGNADIGGEVVSRLSGAPWMGYNVAGFFGVSEHEASKYMDDIPYRGDLSMAAEYVVKSGADQVWIAMPLRDEDKVKQLLYDLRNCMVDIRFVPDLFGLRLLNHSVMDLAGLPVINLSVSPMSGVNVLVKAIEDRVLALLILLLISPVMLFIAFGVKLTSLGPVFYLQERVGWSGQTFNMMKFRSMPIDVEREGVQWGSAHNKTTTSFGSFIRKTSLDELPQFINVLLGDMSIVGPRPERTMFVEKFKEEIPNYMKKHMVKAGITGWAQVNGWRGDTDLTKRIEYDLFYIENWSLWFDFRIIFLTILRGFVSKNAC